ncbi:hypothetical protein ACTMTJ_12940 [Phytohabitans sp. LJ34]|uniref:hypothetical protein n=1 Tax=Phytohabitans sp. LJ34 TaxID=3452217 RepID=UPI003F88A90C
MPSTTDVIQVATGVASLAVSALALREARLQRVGRDGSGPPPPAPAPHLPVATATAVPLEPSPVPPLPPASVPPPAAQPPVCAPPDLTSPPADVPPVTAPLPRPATASGPPGPAPAASPPGAPWTVGPESPSPYARPSGEGAPGTAGPESRRAPGEAGPDSSRAPGEGAAGPDSSRAPGKGAAGPESPWPPAREPAAPASPLPSAWPPGQGAAGPAGRGQPGYPVPPSDGGAQVWPGAQERPAAARAGGWLPWVAVVGVATVFVVLGGVVLFAREDGPTVSGGRAEAVSQGWVFASMALLVLTVVIALVVRGRRAPSRVVWAAVPAVLAAASVAVIVYVLPVHAAVKLGAVVAALGVAAWTAFRR